MFQITYICLKWCECEEKWPETGKVGVPSYRLLGEVNASSRGSESVLNVSLTFVYKDKPAVNKQHN